MIGLDCPIQWQIIGLECLHQPGGGFKHAPFILLYPTSEEARRVEEVRRERDRSPVPPEEE